MTPEEIKVGLYGEIVTLDCYRLQSLKFIPDVVIDIGANIGVFTRYVKTLFPHALIVSVEPNQENIANFKKFTDDTNIILLEKAIGFGDMWRVKEALNGTHESYLSAGLGYEKNQMDSQEERFEKSLVPMVMPDDLIKQFVKEGQKSLMKIDIEGGENAIFIHEPSMNAIATIDYIAMEIHWYALTALEIPVVRQKTLDFVEFLKRTHDCELDHVSFWATKKV